MRRAWDVATGVIGVVVGLAPHVLHHIALLGGTALVAGSGGTALFGAVGLLASLPLLLRLKRRFASLVGAGHWTQRVRRDVRVVGIRDRPRNQRSKRRRQCLCASRRARRPQLAPPLS